MNAKIKDAWEKAAQVHSGDSWAEQTAFLEKFAELIVRECINQVKEQYLPVMEDAAMMNDEHWKGYKHCGVDSVVAIKQHFGVEE